MLGLGIPGVLGAQSDAALVAVEGTVLDVQSERRALLVRSTSPNAPTHETWIHVTYRYGYDAEEYTGHRYAFDEPREGITDDDLAQSRLRVLQPGASLPVLVDPQAPERAVLARRVLGPPLAFSIVGGLAFIVGVGLLVQWLLTRRAQAMFEKRSEDAVDAAGEHR
jgi:hypothetical protein